MEQLEQFWVWIQEKTAYFGLLEWGVVVILGAGLSALPFVAGSGSRNKRRPLPAKPMHIAFHSFQMAPLGRDALLRIQNTREDVVLLSAVVKGSKDIAVKNALAGHEFSTGKVYGIMLEAIGKDRMLPDFEVVITYTDAGRNVYRQSFFPELHGAKPAKRIKRG